MSFIDMLSGAILLICCVLLLYTVVRHRPW